MEIRKCKICGKELTPHQKEFCSRECASKGRTVIRICKNCGKEYRNSHKGLFCSCTCAAEYVSKKRYEKIMQGDTEVMTATYSPTRLVYKYILQEQDNKCAICGMQNIWQNKPIKFIVDHIDGDASNNKRDNLRCICPNCDSQLETYKNTKNHRSTRTHRK